MTMFIIILLVLWLSAMAAWWVFTNFLKSADFSKLQGRLTGKEKKEKAKTPQTQRQLLHGEVQGGKVIQLLRKYEFLSKLGELLEQAGLKWQPAQVVNMSLLLGGGAFAFCFFLLPSAAKMLAVPVAVAAGSIPTLYVMRARKSRLHKFEELFPESLEFVARSMRAGHAFSASLEMIHHEFQEPISGEFRRAFEEHNLGLPLDTALQKMAKRVPLLDVHFFVSAVLLQKRTGGNLAEILDKLAYVIRERFKLRGRIRAISAHGKLTGLALTMIPVAVGLLMFWVNPDYVRFFFLDEVGNYMLGAAVLLQLIGYGIIRKIVQIEV